MARTLDDSLGWAEHGTKLVHQSLTGLDESALSAASGLPRWSRRHVIAHLAANAEAVGNLVHWAATGEQTPMYSSPEQRGADIEVGSTRAGDDLRQWFSASAARLSEAMGALTPEQWSTEVVTAGGRAVPASETPWMRACEVMVHAVDLGTGTTFADLPSGFLEALADDIVTKRSSTATTPAMLLQPTDARPCWPVGGSGELVTVVAPLADLVAYLAGRSAIVGTAPTLPAWL
jgi:maleylpyruvate isomerase